MWSLNVCDIVSCLDKANIQQVYNKKTKSTERVQWYKVSESITSASVPNNAVYRIQVMGKQHKASFIMKCFTKDDQLRDLFHTERFFKREAAFFSKIAPKLQFVQSSRCGVERLELRLPICYSSYTDGVHEILILEDVAERGLRFVRGVSKSEWQLALDTMAHLHAVSLVMKDRTPVIFKGLVKDLLEVFYTEEKKEWYTIFLNNCIDVLKDAVLLHESEESNYFKKFVEVTKKDVYAALMSLSSTRSDLSCITHGNCSMENFMLSKEDAVVINFQHLRYTSLAHDLLFFLLMNKNTCVSTTTFKECVAAYYKSLSHYLNDLSVDDNTLLTWEKLWREIYKYGHFAFLQILAEIPLSIKNASAPKADIFSKYMKTIFLDVKPLEKKEDQLRFVRALRIVVDLNII